MTVTAAGADFAGATAAVAGSTDAALTTARTFATALGMVPIEIADADRPAYHAAASMASNFLVTLEWAAERVGGLDRAALAPLVRATVDNWVADGAHAALTGPIARGDEATVSKPARCRRRARAGPDEPLRRAGRRHARAGRNEGRRMTRHNRTDECLVMRSAA